MSLSKDKQIALTKLGILVVMVLAALWFLLVRPAQTRIREKTNAANSLAQKVSGRKAVIARADQTKAKLKEDNKALQEIEAQMVTGDIYLWIQKTLRDFEIPQQIEFTKYDPPQIIDPNPPLKAPYKVASFAVSGSATYHDLGTFLANFENSYPHIRIRRLEMEPASVDTKNKNEKLAFFMELHVLVRPGKNVGNKSHS